MAKTGISRRGAIQGAAFGVLAGGTAPLVAKASGIKPKLDLEDPVARAGVRATISGSTVPATTHGLSQLHIYA